MYVERPRFVNYHSYREERKREKNGDNCLLLIKIVTVTFDE